MLKNTNYARYRSSEKTLPFENLIELTPDDPSPTSMLEIHNPSGAKYIKVQTTVVDNRSRIASPAFISVCRRRLSKTVMSEVIRYELAEDAKDQLLHAHAILAAIRAALTELSRLESCASRRTEGNSIEILRQIRDALSDGRHTCLATATKLKTIKDLIQHLQLADEVTGEDEEEACETLLDAGMEPYAMTEDFIVAINESR